MTWEPVVVTIYNCPTSDLQSCAEAIAITVIYYSVVLPLRHNMQLFQLCIRDSRWSAGQQTLTGSRLGERDDVPY